MMFSTVPRYLFPAFPNLQELYVMAYVHDVSKLGGGGESSYIPVSQSQIHRQNCHLLSLKSPRIQQF